MIEEEDRSSFAAEKPKFPSKRVFGLFIEFSVAVMLTSSFFYTRQRKNICRSKMDARTLELCAGGGLVDAPYVRSAVQARAQRQALFRNLLSHVRTALCPPFFPVRV